MSTAKWLSSKIIKQAKFADKEIQTSHIQIMNDKMRFYEDKIQELSEDITEKNDKSETLEKALNKAFEEKGRAMCKYG